MPQTKEPKVRHHLVFPYRENEVPHTSWHVAENKVPQGAAAPQGKETVDASNTALSSVHFSGHGKGRRPLLMLLDRWNNQGRVVNDKKTSITAFFCNISTLQWLTWTDWPIETQ